MDFRLKDRATGMFFGGLGYSQHTSVQNDTLTTTIFAQTKKYLLQYGNISDFIPTEILVCTWTKSTPYPYDSYTGDPQVSPMSMIVPTLL